MALTNGTYGTDSLTDIDGFWFGGEGQWYSLEQALAASGDVKGDDMDYSQMSDSFVQTDEVFESLDYDWFVL